MLLSQEIKKMAERENERYSQELKQIQAQLDKAKEEHRKKIARLYERYKKAEEIEADQVRGIIGIFDKCLPQTMLDYFSEREICEAIGFGSYELMREMNLLECCGVDCEGLRLYTPVWR